MNGVDVAIFQALLRPHAVELVAHDYGLDAPSLESLEVGRLAGDVYSGRRQGLVGVSGAAGGEPVGLLLYKADADGSIAIDFLHVMLQRSEAAGQFLRSAVAVLAAKRPPEITVEAFVGGTGAQTERHLAELGFECYPRYLMVCDLRNPACRTAKQASEGGADALSGGYRLLPWGAATHEYVARMLYRAHSARREPRMGGDSLDGALAEVIGVTRSGIFCPNISTLAMAASSPAGVVLVTEPSAEDLVIVEVAVAPEHQGRGVGKAMMSRTLHEAFLAEAHMAWLVVNAANRPAVNLYRSVGFTVNRPALNCRWRAAGP